MKKSNKGMITFLIIAIALSLNYLVYQYIFLPKYNDLKAIKTEYTNKENKLEELVIIKTNIEKVKSENQVLKKSIEEIDKLIATEIDTPQLVYDFYESCKKYSIQGEEVKFFLGSKESSKDGEEVEKKEEENEKENIVRLEILLKVNGEKNNIENYIRNLDKITKRRLNVNNIRLSSKEVEDGSTASNEPNESITLIRSDYIEAEIGFYHYLRLSDEEMKEIQKYDFYPNTIGFDSIPAMFR